MINNYNLELFISNYFKKSIKDISNSDLEKLEFISLDGINIDNQYENIDFKNIMPLFPNLKKIIINNYVFSNEDIETINNNNIIEYVFSNCNFSAVTNFDILGKCKSLTLKRCNFVNYNFFKNNFLNLQYLEIVNPACEASIDINDLNCLLVKELYFERCDLLNFQNISKYINCEIIDVLNTFIDSKFILELEKCTKLKKLYISKEYISDDLINKLKLKNIDIKFDLYAFLEEDDESSI